jgi:hypothetical protein
LVDPPRKFGTLIGSCKTLDKSEFCDIGREKKTLETNLVSENHQTPVGFTSKHTTDTLSRIPHCIEAKEF